jgi:hypothetical protein
VRLTTSLQVGAKYLGCVVCRFHIAAGAGSAPCQKPISINLQKWFLSPTSRLNFGFITEGKLTALLITPSSSGSQLVRQHRTISGILLLHYGGGVGDIREVGEATGDGSDSISPSNLHMFILCFVVRVSPLLLARMPRRVFIYMGF